MGLFLPPVAQAVWASEVDKISLNSRETQCQNLHEISYFKPESYFELYPDIKHGNSVCRAMGTWCLSCVQAFTRAANTDKIAVGNDAEDNYPSSGPLHSTPRVALPLHSFEIQTNRSNLEDLMNFIVVNGELEKVAENQDPCIGGCL
jgi:hypothetical protein